MLELRSAVSRKAAMYVVITDSLSILNRLSKGNIFVLGHPFFYI